MTTVLVTKRKRIERRIVDLNLKLRKMEQKLKAVTDSVKIAETNKDLLKLVKTRKILQKKMAETRVVRRIQYSRLNEISTLCNHNLLVTTYDTEQVRRKIYCVLCGKYFCGEQEEAEQEKIDKATNISMLFFPALQEKWKDSPKKIFSMYQACKLSLPKKTDKEIAEKILEAMEKQESVLEEAE